MRQTSVQSPPSLNSRNTNILLLFKRCSSATRRLFQSTTPFSPQSMHARPSSLCQANTQFPDRQYLCPRSLVKGRQTRLERNTKMCKQVCQVAYDSGFQALRFATAMQLTEVISVPPRPNEICRNGASKDETRKSNGSKSAYGVRESSSRENPAFSSKDEAA